MISQFLLPKPLNDVFAYVVIFKSSTIKRNYKRHEIERILQGSDSKIKKSRTSKSAHNITNSPNKKPSDNQGCQTAFYMSLTNLFYVPE